MTSDQDEFYTLRTAYYLGDFPIVEKEAQSLSHLKAHAAKERDSYLARAYIAQNKYKEASQIIGDNVAIPLLAVKQLLSYKQSTSSEEKELVIETLKSYLEEQSVKDNITFSVVSSQIFIEEKNYQDALILVNQNNSLEKLLMQINIYLKIYRSDLALKCLSKMQEIDDDDPLTTLGHVIINLFIGKDKETQESIELLESLIGNNDTPQLRNMMAIGYMNLLNYSEAFKCLKKSRELSKTMNVITLPSTLINSIICLQYLNKGLDLLDKIYSELEKIAPNHPFLQRQKDTEQLFDKCASNFKV